MSILKRSISIALSTILVLGLTACSGKTEDKNSEEVIKESSSSHYPVTITTYNYEKEPVEITFEKEPESVVAVIRRGMKVEEIPVIMKERSGGVSSISLKKSVYYMIKVTLAILIERIRKY